jgi:hypothetical protein
VIPPARAAVADVVSHVLRFAGVEVRQDDGTHPVAIPPSPQPLPSTRPVSLDEARHLAHFPVTVPATLGSPPHVWVADPARDGSPRVVTLIYPRAAGPIRIDEFDGAIDLTFVKQVKHVQWLEVGPAWGAWLPEPSPVTYVGRDGVPRTATTRLAGPTLLWGIGELGYRIEGATSAAEAARIATSMS